MNMSGSFHPYVYQVLVWSQDVHDADFDVVWNYATVPNQIAISSRWAETIARELINEERAEEGLQLVFVTLADFKCRTTDKGTGIWEYTDEDTGLSVTIHETELKQ